MTDLPKKSSGLGGDGGLGGTSSSGKLERRDPESFGAATFGEETNANWHQQSLAMTAGISESWFGERLIGDTVEKRIKRLGLPDEYLQLNADFLGEGIPSGFIESFGALGEIQQLTESPLAKRVLAYLSGRKVFGIEHGLVQISTNSFINMNDLDGSKGANASLEPGGSGSHNWMGPWGTGFGSRFLQNFRVFKNEKGVETGVWFANAIFGTRPPLRDGDGKLSTSEVFRREVMLPALAKRMIYLAETPFPSSMATLGRNLAFDGLDEKRWPVPLCSISDFELSVCTIENPPNDPETNFHVFPQVVNLGWGFTADSHEELDVVIPSVIDALTVLMSIIEDGFRNYPTLDSPVSWADFFGAIDETVDDPARSKVARWIPATQIGALIRRSNELYGRAHRESSDQDAQWVALNGAGASVAAAINTLVYSHLMPAGEYDQSRAYLSTAIELDHLNESTNALANLGQVYLAAGDVESAESTFLSALERTDKYSEGEASLFLGDIYAARNDTSNATTFYQRAVASGHPEFSHIAQARLNGESQSPAEPVSGGRSEDTRLITKFCVNCGEAFGTSEQKFCGNCGTPR